jgi:glycosyltransferase involved in cell wall biosynthesis
MLNNRSLSEVANGIPCEEISDQVALNKTPLVSVSMITYNHDDYISQAIEGVLQQKTKFSIELIIGEDCSSDRTREIVLEYQKRYPTIIRVLISENNIGMMKNSLRVFAACRGEYMALCEGDDYWTEPLKLEKQVNFLENNSDFSICFHKVKILKNRKLVNDFLTYVPKEETTIEDLAYGNYIHTPSVVFRNGLIKEWPEWYFRSPVGDYPLHLLNAQYGKIKYIDQVMAVYRIHEGGTWSQIDKDDIEKQKKWIKVQEDMANYFSNSVKDILYKVISTRYLNLSDSYRRRGEIELSKQVFRMSADKTFDSIYERYYQYKFFCDPFIKLLIPSNGNFFRTRMSLILFLKRCFSRLIK